MTYGAPTLRHLAHGRCRSAHAIRAGGGPERLPYRSPEYAAKHDSVSHSLTSTTGKPCEAV